MVNQHSHSEVLSQEEVKLIWSQVKEELKLKISPAAFNTWVLLNPLTSLEIINQTQARGTISSPSAFHATNLKKNLYSYLKVSLEKIVQKPVDIEIKVCDMSSVLAEQKQAFTTTKKRTSLQGNNLSSFLSGAGQINYSSRLEQTINDFSIKDEISSPRVEELFSSSNLQNLQQDRALAAARHACLRLDYKFDSFAVSGTNEMAHAAATAVAKRPGSSYNPLFLYGGVGVGKTHLMQAIGHFILEKDPSTKIIYCTGEEFTNEIIDAIRNKNASSFKKRFRTAQVLLIDDIQFIAGKNAVQEEFFHTFNALIKTASQIVLTSDRSPSEIKLLEDRLKSRFEAGLMVDIQQPSLELRTAIVLIKAKANGLSLPISLAEKIASTVDGARRIEGVITTVRSEVELNHKIVDEQLISQILSKETNENSPSKLRIQPQKVIKKVSDHYGINQSVLKGKCREKEVVRARHMAMYLLKTDLGMSYVEIGRWFANRDHTSVMHARSKMTALLKNDSLLQEEYQQIRASLVND